jgi:rhomboid protease GluP
MRLHDRLPTGAGLQWKHVDKRRMCPNCRAFITTDDKVCPYCDVKLGPRAVDVRAPDAVLGGLLSADRFTTFILLMFNSGLYAATMLYSMKTGYERFLTDIDGQTLYYFGAKFAPDILNGQWWRLVTAGFLHGGLFHFIINTFALINLAPVVEQAFGTYRFVTIYFAATVLGFAASTFWSNALSIGASAGLCGLVGAMIAIGYVSRSIEAQALKSYGTRAILYILVIGIMPGLRIDNAAHIGGAIGGFVVALAAGTPRLISDWRETIWKVAATVSLVITGIAFVLMFLNFRALTG